MRCSTSAPHTVIAVPTAFLLIPSSSASSLMSSRVSGPPALRGFTSQSFASLSLRRSSRVCDPVDESDRFVVDLRDHFRLRAGYVVVLDADLAARVGRVCSVHEVSRAYRSV